MFTQTVKYYKGTKNDKVGDNFTHKKCTQRGHFSLSIVKPEDHGKYTTAMKHGGPLNHEAGLVFISICIFQYFLMLTLGSIWKQIYCVYIVTSQISTFPLYISKNWVKVSLRKLPDNSKGSPNKQTEKIQPSENKFHQPTWYDKHLSLQFPEFFFQNLEFFHISRSAKTPGLVNRDTGASQ